MSTCLRKCHNFNKFKFVLVEVKKPMWLRVNITIESHMSNQWFGNEREELTKEEAAVQFQN